MNCGYFALCRNKAEYLVHNPALGDVPTCKRCAEKAQRLGVPASSVRKIGE